MRLYMLIIYYFALLKVSFMLACMLCFDIE